MMRLALAELRDHLNVWAGGLVVTLCCGAVGAWAASFAEMAAGSSGAAAVTLHDASTMVLSFSLVAAVPVLAATANLTVAASREAYARWQLVGVRPGTVRAVVVAQMAVVGVMGAGVGFMLGGLLFGPLYSYVMASSPRALAVAPLVGWGRLPAVVLTVACVFVCAGLGAARRAAMTSPMEALRAPEPRRVGLTWVRVLVFVASVGLAGYALATMVEAAGAGDANAVMTWSLVPCVFGVVAVACLAPVLLPVLMGAWTVVLPACATAWLLARRSARHSLSASTSVETPVMVAFGLVAGMYSLVRLCELYAGARGIPAGSGWYLETTVAFLMFGGPVLICAAGATVSVVMAARNRERELSLLEAVGARPLLMVAVTVVEALVHTITATLAGTLTVLLFGAATAAVMGVPLLSGLVLGPGLVVSGVGFVLVLTALLLPAARALSCPVATGLRL